MEIKKGTIKQGTEKQNLTPTNRRWKKRKKEGSFDLNPVGIHTQFSKRKRRKKINNTKGKSQKILSKRNEKKKMERKYSYFYFDIFHILKEKRENFSKILLPLQIKTWDVNRLTQVWQW